MAGIKGRNKGGALECPASSTSCGYFAGNAKNQISSPNNMSALSNENSVCSG